ncbi:unnamed protein product [Prunus armeniaca]|uniref:Transmembrane protein n=1 Tax=Prunus armeniaca TaxID=36596 RepID=A0A6J5VV32_PRUAR|nr:unnamed protein product [Prunus armeniaca]CAB4320135.1 unnamed protein product [Prunus armeniaca]
MMGKCELPNPLIESYWLDGVGQGEGGDLLGSEGRGWPGVLILFWREKMAMVVLVSKNFLICFLFYYVLIVVLGSYWEGWWCEGWRLCNFLTFHTEPR